MLTIRSLFLVFSLAAAAPAVSADVDVGVGAASSDVPGFPGAVKYAVGARYSVTPKVDLEAVYSGYQNVVTQTQSAVMVGANYKF